MKKKVALGTFILSMLSGCANDLLPQIRPVSDFKVHEYTGQWYEIARIDNRFEKGLICVSARYEMNPDNKITVINRGFDHIEQKWKEATGEASFVEGADRGFLKVSFFKPFYGIYKIVALDEAYQWSMVIGKDSDYLWILSRQKEISPDLYQKLLNQAKSIGFDISRVIPIKQNCQ